MIDPVLDTRVVASPGWWLDRLSRKLDVRASTMVGFDRYYRGDHRLMFATQKFREAFGGLFSTVADNFCEVVVDKLVERLAVQGFRFAGNPEANDRAWEIWQANSLDADFAKACREGFVKGEFAMTVWAGQSGPRLTVEDPLNVVVALDPSDTRVRRAALKRWWDPDLGRVFATLYLPDDIWKLQGPRQDSQATGMASEGIRWERRQVPGEEWPLPNALREVPVVAFPNKPDLSGAGVSELSNVIPIQDAINKLLSDMLLASEFGAFRQKWASNVVLEINPDTGRPVEPWKIAVDKLLVAPPPTPGEPETRFGEFGQTDLGPYTTAIDTMIHHLAVVTRMPPHYLLGNSGVWPSGESLRSAETGLVRKARDRMRDLAEPLETVVRLALLADGQDREVLGQEIETLWADPETQTESAHIDALTKLLSLGVPEEGLWEMIPASPTQIERWKQLKAANAEAAAAAAPQPTQLQVQRNDATGVTTISRVAPSAG